MIDTRTRPRSGLVALGIAWVLAAVFLLGRVTSASPEPTAGHPTQPLSTQPSGSTPSTDPQTGRSTEPTESELLRADYVPTTLADATPKERTGAEIEITVRGFVRAWSLHGTVDERKAALEPYVSTPVMLDAFALSDPADVPQGGLGAPPKVGAVSDDSAHVFVIFLDSTTVTVQVVKLDAGWRVYQVDGA